MPEEIAAHKDGRLNTSLPGAIGLQRDVQSPLVRDPPITKGLGDVTKVNCFYAGGASETTLMQSAQTRFSFYTPPGPCSTGVPLSAIAYEGMATEIEVVAMV